MTTSNDKPDLTPRAIAVLVAMRNGPRTAAQLRARISDQRADNTDSLLRDMADLGLLRLVHGTVWYLDEEGRAWLETHGIPVDYDLTYPASAYATGVQ